MALLVTLIQTLLLPVNEIRLAVMPCNDFPVSAMIAGQITDQIGGAGGNPVGLLERMVLLFNEGVEYAGTLVLSNGCYLLIRTQS